MLLAAEGRRARCGVVLGGVFGFGFFGTLLSWISIVGWVAWAALVLLEAAFVAIFGAAWATVSRARLSPLLRIVAPAVLWVAVVEFLRSIVPLGGFTWGQLAQSQHDSHWLLRAAAPAGGWAIAFLVVTCNSLLAQAWRALATRVRYAAALVAAASIVMTTPWLLPPNRVEGPRVRVGVAQGNVPRAFPGDSYEKQLAITRSHRRLTEALAASPNPPDLVVWPESSVGIDLTRDALVAEEVASAARAVAAPMIVGGNIDVDEDRYEVVAFEISPEGRVTDVYRKNHLVPFGEYVPARRWLGWIPMLEQVPRDAVPGDEKTVFAVAGGRVAPVLSYEGDFGSLVRARIAAGGRLLVVATNTSTWRSSWASAQHLALSQVRAAENGVWVVHAAISGISAIITPEGRIVDRLPLWTAGTMLGDARFANHITLYARTGDWLAIGCVALTGPLVAWALWRSRRPAAPEGLASKTPAHRPRVNRH